MAHDVPYSPWWPKGVGAPWRVPTYLNPGDIKSYLTEYYDAQEYYDQLIGPRQDAAIVAEMAGDKGLANRLNREANQIYREELKALQIVNNYFYLARLLMVKGTEPDVPVPRRGPPAGLGPPVVPAPIPRTSPIPRHAPPVPHAAAQPSFGRAFADGGGGGYLGDGGGNAPGFAGGGLRGFGWGNGDGGGSSSSGVPIQGDSFTFGQGGPSAPPNPFQGGPGPGPQGGGGPGQGGADGGGASNGPPPASPDAGGSAGTGTSSGTSGSPSGSPPVQPTYDELINQGSPILAPGNAPGPGSPGGAGAPGNVAPNAPAPEVPSAPAPETNPGSPDVSSNDTGGADANVELSFLIPDVTTGTDSGGTEGEDGGLDGFDGGGTDGIADGALADGGTADGAGSDGSAGDGATDGGATDGASGDGGGSDGAASDGASGDGGGSDGAASDGAMAMPAFDGGSIGGSDDLGGTNSLGYGPPPNYTGDGGGTGGGAGYPGVDGLGFGPPDYGGWYPGLEGADGSVGAYPYYVDEGPYNQPPSPMAPHFIARIRTHYVPHIPIEKFIKPQHTVLYSRIKVPKVGTDGTDGGSIGVGGGGGGGDGGGGGGDLPQFRHETHAPDPGHDGENLPPPQAPPPPRPGPLY